MPSNSKDKPNILVVIPTLGQRLEYLRLTLDSVQQQAPTKFDIVMVGPLSNPGLSKLAKEYSAKMIADPGSISAAVNKGIAQAKTHHKYISWIGDDDLLAPNSFKLAKQALDNTPEGVLAFGYCDYIDADGKLLFTSKAGRLAPWLMSWGPNLVPLPGILFRLSSLNKAGEFDTQNKYSMDLDMLLRLRRIGKLVNTKATLASFRWHATSATVANKDASLREAELVKRRYLPKSLRLFAPIWESPVRLASKLAARRVNAIASK